MIYAGLRMKKNDTETTRQMSCVFHTITIFLAIFYSSSSFFFTLISTVPLPLSHGVTFSNFFICMWFHDFIKILHIRDIVKKSFNSWKILTIYSRAESFSDVSYQFLSISDFSLFLQNPKITCGQKFKHNFRKHSIHQPTHDLTSLLHTYMHV